jgi:hypothetical protein
MGDGDGDGDGDGEGSGRGELQSCAEECLGPRPSVGDSLESLGVSTAAKLKAAWAVALAVAALAALALAVAAVAALALALALAVALAVAEAAQRLCILEASESECHHPDSLSRRAFLPNTLGGSNMRRWPYQPG